MKSLRREIELYIEELREYADGSAIGTREVANLLEEILDETAEAIENGDN